MRSRWGCGGGWGGCDINYLWVAFFLICVSRANAETPALPF